MATLRDFLLTTLRGGLLILVPLLLVYLMIDEMLELLVVLATPISELFPDTQFELLGDPLVIALLLLVGAAFFCGLALKAGPIRRFGAWIEGKTLGKLPIYGAIKGVTEGMFGSQQRFRTGLWSYNEHGQRLVYIIEGQAPAKLTILVPDAPGGFSGALMWVDADQVVELDASLGDVSAVLSRWGVGLQQLATQSRRPH